MFDLIEHAETNEVDNARRLLLGQLRDWRTAVRTNTRRTGQQMGSTNLLTAFGTPRRELQLSMHTSTGRITPAQFAAALVGYCLFVLHMLGSGTAANEGA